MQNRLLRFNEYMLGIGCTFIINTYKHVCISVVGAINAHHCIFVQNYAGDRKSWVTGRQGQGLNQPIHRCR